MALFKPFRGNRASLSAQPLHDGYAYFCVNDGSFHIDYIDADGNLRRKQINDAMNKRLEILESIVNNSPFFDESSIGFIDAGTIMDDNDSDFGIIDPGTII